MMHPIRRDHLGFYFIEQEYLLIAFPHGTKIKGFLSSQYIKSKNEL